MGEGVRQNILLGERLMVDTKKVIKMSQLEEGATELLLPPSIKVERGGKQLLLPATRGLWSSLEDFKLQGENQLSPSAAARERQEQFLALEEEKRRNEMLEAQERANQGVCDDKPGFCAFLLTVGATILVFATLPFSLCCVIKIVKEYERAVIFRLGRMVNGGAR